MFVCCIKLNTRAIYHADETREALREFKLTKTEEYDRLSGCIYFRSKVRNSVSVF